MPRVPISVVDMGFVESGIRVNVLMDSNQILLIALNVKSFVIMILFK